MDVCGLLHGTERELRRELQVLQIQKTPPWRGVLFSTWCPEEDSNLHEVAPAST